MGRGSISTRFESISLGSAVYAGELVQTSENEGSCCSEYGGDGRSDGEYEEVWEPVAGTVEEGCAYPP